MAFPVVAMPDSVRVHKALLDSLGVKKLQAAAGASGGSIPEMEWAALHPGLGERVVHVIRPGFDIHPYVIQLLPVWASPIMLDARRNKGDYCGRDEPVDGVAVALMNATVTARSFGWAERTFGYNWADPATNPGDEMGNAFAIQDTLAKAGAARARATDANSLIYMAKAKTGSTGSPTTRSMG